MNESAPSSIRGEVAANIANLRRAPSGALTVVPKGFADLLADEVERLDRLINTPQTADFLEAVRLEAAHQRERWANEHDAGKTDVDWFWLIGHLAGKALLKPEKILHHIITTAAVCLNWHAAKVGADNRMRPGIEGPQG